MIHDTLGDRIKQFESISSPVLLPSLPVVVRVDGRGFSKFTAGMQRPFDQAMMDLMHHTAQYLLKQLSGRFAYTQSDEITVVLADSPDATAFFGGRVQKIASIAAGLATATFVSRALQLWPDRCAKRLPVFDARVFAVPSREAAVQAVWWRELDATKNAVSQAARAYFSHAQLQGQSSAQMQEMLFSKAGINFNDYPAAFKRGQYFRPTQVVRTLSSDEIAKIPPHQQPDGPIIRREIHPLNLPRLNRLANPIGVLFDGLAPELTPPP